MNPQNLIPNAERTHEELAEMGRKGGIVSGEIRREKRTIREIAKTILEDTKIQDEVVGEISLKEATIRKLLDLALNAEGDLSAIKYLFEVIGESPAQQIEVKQGVTITEEQKNYFESFFGMDVKK